VKELEQEVGELEEEVSSVNHNIAENQVSPPPLHRRWGS
jgi:hypothetical protein